MARWSSKRRSWGSGRHGLTMVEIMIVVAAIAVLAAIAVPAVRKGRTRLKQAEAETQLEMLAASIRQLAWDTGRWPGGLARNASHDPEYWDLSDPDVGLLSASPGLFPNWKGPYIPEVPVDPWGNDYFLDPDYRIGNRSDRVVVGSFGPNGLGRNYYDDDNIYVILL